MIKKFNITPKWEISDFHHLDYFLTTHKDQKLMNQYIDSGHSENHMTLYNCHQPSFMPDCVFEYIIPQFNFLNNVAVAINYFKPGQYLPLHIDIFEKYIKIYNVPIDKIVRYVVMLEEGISGQILQIEDNFFTNWNPGDCFGWDYLKTHAFYNLSLEDRYAIQITGVLK
jgi:hypothetical protein